MNVSAVLTESPLLEGSTFVDNLRRGYNRQLWDVPQLTASKRKYAGKIRARCVETRKRLMILKVFDDYRS